MGLYSLINKLIRLATICNIITSLIFLFLLYMIVKIVPIIKAYTMLIKPLCTRAKIILDNIIDVFFLLNLFRLLYIRYLNTNSSKIGPMMTLPNNAIYMLIVGIF